MLLPAAVWVLALGTRAPHTYKVSTHRPIYQAPNSPDFKINYKHFRRKSLSYRKTQWRNRICVQTLFCSYRFHCQKNTSERLRAYLLSTRSCMHDLPANQPRRITSSAAAKIFFRQAFKKQTKQSFVHMSILLVCLCTMCMQCPQRPEGGHWILWDWNCSCESPCGCWALSLGSVEEQPVLLLPALSLAPSRPFMASKLWSVYVPGHYSWSW